MNVEGVARGGNVSVKVEYFPGITERNHGNL
jgi:hypothetical protein